MTIFADIRTEITRNLLLYAAGQQCFCPVCSVVLDWKTVCCVSFPRTGRGTAVICCTCFERAINSAADPGEMLERCEIDSAWNWHVGTRAETLPGKPKCCVEKGVQIVKD